MQEVATPVDPALTPLLGATSSGPVSPSESSSSSSASSSSSSSHIPMLPGAMTDEQWLAQLTPAEQTALAEYKRQIQDKHPEALLLGDRLLMRLLFTRKLEIGRALVLLEKHLAWRQKYDIDALRPSDVEAVLRSGMSTVAFGPRHRTNDGAGITYLFFRKAPAKTDKVKPTIREMIRGSWLMGELMSRDNIDNDRKGIVIVEDFAGARFLSTHMWSSEEMREMMSCTQDSMPGRIRGIWVINAPWFVRLLMAMIRPFMKQKLQNKCRVLTEADLARLIPSDAIIPELGGTGTAVQWNDVCDMIMGGSTATAGAAAAAVPSSH